MVGTVKSRENVQHLGGGCLFNITLGFTKRKLVTLPADSAFWQRQDPESSSKCVIVFQ